jgi:hypothetical protein
MRRLNFGICAAGIFNKLTGAIFAHRRIERKCGWRRLQPVGVSACKDASLKIELLSEELKFLSFRGALRAEESLSSWI